MASPSQQLSSVQDSPNMAKAADTHLASSSIQPCVSAFLVANNDDLLTEILLRLPIKSLLTFKAVSKHWLSLISNPTFAHHFSPYSTTASGLFLRSSSLHTDCLYHFLDLNKPDPNATLPSTSSAPFKDLSSLLNHPNARILQSCNGLFLCWSFLSGQSDTHYYVLNPTTKQYSVLPPIGSTQEILDSVLAMTLAFDPSKSPYYKVVCIRYYNCPILIYSSEDGIWKACSDALSEGEEFDYFNYGVYWNGAVHWVCSWGNCFYFKLDDQQLRELPMPHPWFTERAYWYFGESRGHLHLIEMDGPRFIEMDVYEMDSDHSRWYVKYHVDLDALPLVFPDILGVGNHVQLWDPENFMNFNVTSVIRSEADDDSYLVLEIPGKIVRYNIQDKSFHKLCDVLSDPQTGDIGTVAGLHSYYAYQYIVSLCCV